MLQYIVVRKWPTLRGDKTHQVASGPFDSRAKAKTAIRQTKRAYWDPDYDAKSAYSIILFHPWVKP